MPSTRSPRYASPSLPPRSTLELVQIQRTVREAWQLINVVTALLQDVNPGISLHDGPVWLNTDRLTSTWTKRVNKIIGAHLLQLRVVGIRQDHLLRVD